VVVLDQDEVEEPEAMDRINGSAATSVIGVMADVDILRVHDVRENVEAIRVARAVFPTHDE
jgi:dihydropteroate synthase